MADINKIRHSLAHILAMAVKELYPQVKLGIGPAIETGFYYDFDFAAGQGPTLEDLPALEKAMRKIISQNLDFTSLALTSAEAKKLLAGEPYKLELLQELETAGEKITGYRSGDFVDLCAGPHIANTKEIDPDSFKLDRIAGAYWKGSEKNKMLTRIYGLAFATKQELADYVAKMEEAKKRDHRKLGKELDLFHLDDQVGLGLPLWHPKGALLWRIIEDFWYREHLKNGYELVRSPHIGNRLLWETSGHWGFYNSSMYPPLEAGQSLEEKQRGEKAAQSEEYLLKPMNCPFHVQIYKSNPHSYRDLPIRWAECGTVYRFEKKGELSGLTRVRGFTQDDAHIICRQDQVKTELGRVIDFIMFMYQAFGFDPAQVKVYLSLRDPENKKKYAGNDDGWDFTEKVLREVATDKKLNFTEEKGEAAFYGPKLDFKIKDVLGREWQCSTLQFDFNLPERFDLTFINQDGQAERPYMLHRALFGSFERFIGLLIEHYGGSFPLWLSPVQVKVLPISEKHKNYAEEITTELRQADVRVKLDDSDESLGKKIRAAKMEKVPYLVVLGDKEVEEKLLTVEGRDGTSDKMSLDEFLKKIAVQIDNHQ